MATTRSGGGKGNVATTSGQKKPSWYTGKKTTATATVKKVDNTRQQYENAFGKKEEKKEQKKPNWYTGKKTKATATVKQKGKNG